MLVLILHYLLLSVLVFIDSSIKLKKRNKKPLHFKLMGKRALYVCQRVNGVEVTDKLPA